VEILLVKNGREAVDLFQKEEIDLVLMDIHMPSMDGYEAAQHPRTPIIGVTADAFRRDIQRCFDSGMDRVLIKPLRREKLFRTLAFFFNLPDEYTYKDQAISSGTVLDRKALLREIQDEEIADELIQSFTSALGRQIELVQASRKAGGWQTLHREEPSEIDEVCRSLLPRRNVS